MNKRTLGRKSDQRRKYIWCGTGRSQSTFRQFIEPHLSKAGFTCAAEYNLPRDLPSVLSRTIGFAIITGGRGPLINAVQKLCHSGNAAMIMAPKHTWGALREQLVEHGFIGERTLNLHGYFDEEAAANPGPVLNPVLTKEYLDSLQPKQDKQPQPKPSKKKSETTKVQDRPHEVFVENGKTKVLLRLRSETGGDFVASASPVHLIDADMTCLSLNDMRGLLGCRALRSVQVDSGFIRDSEGEKHAIRWATVEEALSCPHTHLRSPLESSKPKQKQKPKRAKYEVYRMGGEVWVNDKGRTGRPVIFDGVLYPNGRAITIESNGEISQPHVSRGCRRGTHNGVEMRFAELAETEGVTGYWRNEARDRLEKNFRKAKANKTAAKKTATPVAPPPPLRVVVSSPVAARAKPASPTPSIATLVNKLSEVEQGAVEVEVSPGVRTKINLDEKEKARLMGELIKQMAALTGGD